MHCDKTLVVLPDGSLALEIRQQTLDGQVSYIYLPVGSAPVDTSKFNTEFNGQVFDADPVDLGMLGQDTPPDVEDLPSLFWPPEAI